MLCAFMFVTSSVVWFSVAAPQCALRLDGASGVSLLNDCVVAFRLLHGNR
jgi:hypothetical protein